MDEDWKFYFIKNGIEDEATMLEQTETDFTNMIYIDFDTMKKILIRIDQRKKEVEEGKTFEDIKSNILY